VSPAATQSGRPDQAYASAIACARAAEAGPGRADRAPDASWRRASSCEQETQGASAAKPLFHIPLSGVTCSCGRLCVISPPRNPPTVGYPTPRP